MSCYDPVGTTCSGAEQPGARALADAILHRYPAALIGHGSAYGIYNCRKNTANDSMSVHGEGRAIDVGFPVVTGGHAEAHALCAWLVSHSSGLGIQFLVYWERKWGCSYGWDLYGGSNKHHDHVHVEVKWSHALDASKITDYLASLDVSVKPEDDLPYTKDELKDIFKDALREEISAGLDKDGKGTPKSWWAAWFQRAKQDHFRIDAIKKKVGA